MRRIATSLAVAAALAVAPAAAASAAAAPASAGKGVTAALQAPALWELNSVWSSESTCNNVGAIGVWQGLWYGWDCRWDSYRGGWALWVRVG